MNFKHVKNISEETATMLIYQPIGDSLDKEGRLVSGVSGTMFAQEMQYLVDVLGVKHIDVRINSVGGSVIEGYSILSSILNNSKKIDIHTHIDGLAASTAGWIAISGKKVFMADYGLLMLHDPRGIDDQELLNLFKNSIVTLFAGRTGKTAEEIADMMTKETWLEPSQAFEFKVVDKIIPSGKKVKIQKEQGVYNLSELSQVFNQLINNQTKPSMNKVAKVLNLQNEASEDAIVTKVTSLQEENETLKTSLKKYQDKEEADRLAAENAKKIEVKNILDKAEEEKKISTEDRPNWEKLAMSDLALAKNTLDKIPVTKQAIDVIKTLENKGGEPTKEKTYNDYSATELSKLKNEQPEVFQKLWDKEYGA